MELLTKAETARRLRCSPRTLDRHVAAGTGPRPVRVLGRARFAAADVEAVANGRHQEKAPFRVPDLASTSAVIARDLAAHLGETADREGLELAGDIAALAHATVVHLADNGATDAEAAMLGKMASALSRVLRMCRVENAPDTLAVIILASCLDFGRAHLVNAADRGSA